jgi:hypothetical protein
MDAELAAALQNEELELLDEEGEEGSKSRRRDKKKGTNATLASCSIVEKKWDTYVQTFC